MHQTEMPKRVIGRYIDLNVLLEMAVMMTPVYGDTYVERMIQRNRSDSSEREKNLARYSFLIGKYALYGIVAWAHS